MIDQRIERLQEQRELGPVGNLRGLGQGVFQVLAHFLPAEGRIDRAGERDPPATAGLLGEGDHLAHLGRGSGRDPAA